MDEFFNILIFTGLSDVASDVYVGSCKVVFPFFEEDSNRVDYSVRALDDFFYLLCVE